jgi:hypothetical protein
MAAVIDKRQTATIIAALRFWQDSGMAVHAPLPLYLAELSTDQGRVAPLSVIEVDALCETLRSPHFRSEDYRPRAVVVHETGELEVLADPEVQIERIATDDVRCLVDGCTRDLRGVLGEEFRHLISVR